MRTVDTTLLHMRMCTRLYVYVFVRVPSATANVCPAVGTQQFFSRRMHIPFERAGAESEPCA